MPTLLVHKIDNVDTVATFLTIMKVAIREAKNNLSKYGNLANAGDTITVCKNGQPWFDLVPHHTKQRSTRPLVQPKARISAQQATEPVNPEDIAGWM